MSPTARDHVSDPALDEALDALRRDGPCAALCVGVGAAALAAPGGVVFPPAVRRGAELALASGRPRLVHASAHAWVAGALDEPLPAVLAAALPAAPPAGRSLAHLLEPALRRLRDALLPRALARDPFLGALAASPSLAPVTTTLQLVAPTRLPVLLLGETGTGKEVLARALHDASGRRGGFVAENCAALPESLLEAELFGVRRGAFTGASEDRRGRFAEADGGTLLLDEVGDLPLGLQAKLLRVLQEGEVRALGADRARPVDVRIVAATHRDLESAAPPAFRRDLYYRLAGVVVHLPALRDRTRDLPYLCATLLARAARDGLGPGRRLGAAALAALARWPFPGNVRELDNLLRRAAAPSPAALIPCDVVGLPRREAAAVDTNLEVRAILDALACAGGCKAEAARRLGWTRQKLYRRLEALSLFDALETAR